MTNKLADVLERARNFRKKPAGKVKLHSLVAQSRMVQDAVEAIVKGTGCSREDAEHTVATTTNLGTILTPEDLAERLKVTVEWISRLERLRWRHSRIAGVFVSFSRGCYEIQNASHWRHDPCKAFAWIEALSQHGCT
jgi:hypothetical protein